MDGRQDGQQYGVSAVVLTDMTSGGPYSVAWCRPVSSAERYGNGMAVEGGVARDRHVLFLLFFLPHFDCLQAGYVANLNDSPRVPSPENKPQAY